MVSPNSIIASAPGSHSPLLALAPELKQAIFSQLPDVSSVVSVLLTCSSFYYTFLQAESLILTRILQRRIDTDIAFDAVAVWKAFKLGPSNLTWSKEKVNDLMAVYDKERRCSLSQEWKVQDALALDKVHNHIKFFADGLISSALALAPGLAAKAHIPGASHPERNRVKRTFYRFELYCNLFRRRKLERRELSRNRLNPEERFSHQEQRTIFFDRFPPWENEQFACVREYLFTQVSIPYDDVAAHDIEWAKHADLFDDDRHDLGNSSKEHHLSLGLAHIRRLFYTATFQSRCQFLYASGGYDPDFLHQALTFQRHDADPNDNLVLSEYSDKDRARILDDRRAADWEPGPRMAWFWAYADQSQSRSRFYSYYKRRYIYLRRRCYVMWDWTTWLETGLLLKLFNRNNDPLDESDLHIPFAKPYRLEQSMRDSFKMRNQIWRRGGRGWWNPGDESQVKWPGGKPPNGWKAAYSEAEDEEA